MSAGSIDAHKIEARLGTVVTQLNIERRLAVLANGESIEFTKACLAMGSRPVRPQVAGTSLGNVIYLRTIRDALALREMASLEKTIMVVGGGLLACEAAASLRMMKMKLGLMHRDAYLLNRYVDPETGTWLTDYFAKHGVMLSMGEALNGFEGKTVLRNVQTKSGNRFPVGLAVVAVGAEPNLDLVRNTPLAGPHGSPVTEYLETEEKGIYAIGDLAFYPDRIMGGMRRQTHWDNAREQGLVLALILRVPMRRKSLSPGISRGTSSVLFSFANKRSAKWMRLGTSCAKRRANELNAPIQ